ncbi:uncharacterized protein LOC143781810 [Ranitomeya variabilis]|uniref:uncharacterized protein LOC143781810 n=1 Tax=Ranitomeya variabilis TaxID=490064 RepID=UPI004056FEB9
MSVNINLKQFFSVTRTEKDPNNIKKNIRCLERQYYSLIKGLKMQTIIFEPGEKYCLYTSPNVNTVQVSKGVIRQAAFSNQTHIKEVALDWQHKDYLLSRDGVWHAHLDIHRMMLLDHHCTSKAGTTEHKKNLEKSPSSSKSTSTKNLNKHLLPQKQNHPRSEAARKLGLYGLH